MNLKSILDTDRWKVSAWICENNPTIVRANDIEQALNSLKPSLSHRADRMFRWLHSKFPLGQEFTINDLGKWELHKNDPTDSLFMVGGSLVSSPLAPVGWNRDIAEMSFMVTEVLCNEMGLLVSQNNNEYQVSPKGLVYLEGRAGQQASLAACRT